MSRRFDKKNSVKFQLVHRSQQDSRYFDEDASASVLVPIVDKNQKRKQLRTTAAEDLENEVKLKVNEGKAAIYGVTFDDTKYDYLQHLKPIGSGDGIFISRKDDSVKNKGKNKGLAALLGGDELLPGNERKIDYNAMQDVPDEIKGFKPDLNPDLREALTALEDENYLDQEQDVDEIDVFEELLGNVKGQELTLREYDELDEDYQDNHIEDWDYDNFEDDYEDVDAHADASGNGNGDYQYEGIQAPEPNFNWERDFMKYKNTRGRHANEFDSDNEFDSENDDEDGEGEEDEGDVVGELPNLDARGLKSSKSSKKKSKRKKGATTDTSSYSMSSSALCRTEQMTIIDDQFDVLREKYDAMDEEEEDYRPFNVEEERDDFMDLVDDFLENYQLEKRGRRVVKKNPEMEKYREAALAVTKDNSRIKAKREKSLAEGIEKMKI